MPARSKTASSSSASVLTRRALNRATLARQMLLERRVLPAADAIEHLIAMQAQAPDAPYVGLWTRLTDFHQDELARMVAGRDAVRTHLMRVTIHLVTARDCLRLRPLMRPVLERGFAGSPFSKQVAGIDTASLLSAARDLLVERPRTRAELGPLLAGRWPERDANALAYAVTYLLPMVQIPPRGIWGAGGVATWALAEEWLGRAFEMTAEVDDLVMRYLAAYGPASVRDVQSWSGLTRLRAVLDRLRDRLVTFRDENGVELFDLPEAPRPDPETPAPPRFLPEYDNIQFAFADRTRIMDAGYRVPLFPGNGGSLGTLLVDGRVSAEWKVVRERYAATLLVRPHEALAKRDRAEAAEEGEALLRFVAADAVKRDVRFEKTM